METMGEIIPFARELLNQKPGRGMLKIYMIGSTLAVLGAVGGLLDAVLLPFTNDYDYDAEETAVETTTEKTEQEKKKKALAAPRSHATVVQADPLDPQETAEVKVEAKHLVRRRSSAVR